MKLAEETVKTISTVELECYRSLIITFICICRNFHALLDFWNTLEYLKILGQISAYTDFTKKREFSPPYNCLPYMVIS